MVVNKKTFTLENYLSDDSDFRIGIEFENLDEYKSGKINSLQVKGKFALGLNEIDIYSQTQKDICGRHVFWDDLNPLDYIHFLTNNIEHYQSQCDNVSNIRNPILYCKQDSKLEPIRDKNEFINRHMLLPSRDDRMSVFIRNIGGDIELNWNNSTFQNYEHKLGSSQIPLETFNRTLHFFFDYISGLDIKYYSDMSKKAMNYTLFGNE